MTVKEYLEKFKKIQGDILEFLEKSNDIEETFKNLITNNELEKKSNENLYDITLILHLLASIAENHFLEPNFYPKLEKLFLMLKDEILASCTDSDIFNIFKNDKRFLLFLFEEKVIKMNNYIASQMQNKKYMKKYYPQYFFPELKSFLKSKKDKYDISTAQLLRMANEFNKKGEFSDVVSISEELRKRESEKKNDHHDDWISEYSRKLPDNFYENRRIGANTSKIYQLIREDLIDDFITYVERENYSLSATVEVSYYETSSFLLNRPKTTLIEYASYYGSVQIFKYLYKNNVKLTPSIWPYAIHSNNPELIHLLEECQIEPTSYLQIYNEAIRCHHNSVASYISINYLDKEKVNDEIINDSFLTSLGSHNFEFINEDSIDNCSFFNLCKYDYCSFVNYLIQQKNVDVNEKQMNENDEEYILHCAIENGHINIIKLLLENESLDINCIKKYTAQNHKSTKEIGLLFDYSIGTEWASWNEWTDDYYDIMVEISALNYAIEKENIEIIKLLLTNQKLDINLFSKFSMEYPEDNYLLMTPLQAAIEKENLEIIQILLLNDNVDPNIYSVALSNNPDGNGKFIQRRERTAFHIAVENENIEIIKILLENDKIDVNCNRTWFRYIDEHEEWSSCIIQYEKSALHIAIYKGNIDIVNLLLNDKRTDVNHLQLDFKSEIYFDDSDDWDSRRAPDENPTFENSYLWADTPNELISTFNETKAEKTPLLYAVESSLDITGILLNNKNVDVNLTSKFVEIEIDKENNKNINKVEEKTPLYFAIENGKNEYYDNIEFVKLLLQNKRIDIEFPSKILDTSRQIGEEEEEEEEEECENHNNENKQKDNKNAQGEVKEVTPLQIAKEKGDKELISLLENR